MRQEHADMSEGDEKELSRRFIRKSKNTISIKKHRVVPVSDIVDKLSQQTCCATGNCLQVLCSERRQMIEYQVARWRDLDRKPKTAAVFAYVLQMKKRVQQKIDSIKETGVRASKNGTVRAVYSREEKALQNMRMQFTLYDTESREEVPVCKAALRAITGTFGGNLVPAACRMIDDGHEQYFNELLFMRAARDGTKSSTIMSWVSHQMLLVGDAIPNEDKKMFLPYDNWSSAYEHYKQCVSDGMFWEFGVENPASESLFHKLVKLHFNPNIRFAKKYNTFTKCNTCSDYKILMKRCGSGSVSGRIWLKHYFRHLMWQSKCRIKYHNHRTKGKCFPHKYMSLILDGSDNHSFEIPFFGDKRKDWGGVDRPKTRSTGVLVHSSSNDPTTGGLRLYITDERTKKGTNFNILCLLHTLLAEWDARGGKLPTHLYIQLDSAGDNKSKTMMRFCEWLVKSGVFLKVKVCMLPVGHTHEDIDAGFGRLNRKFVQAGTVTSTTYEGLIRAQMATKSTRDLVWIWVS
jgi:hypothetical protein